jgi:hypothetical protein
MTHASHVSRRATSMPRCRNGSAEVKRFALARQALLVLSLGFAAWPSLADDDCDVPLQQWQPREAVRRMAAAQGWQVQRLTIDDGCYEIRATDAQGRAFKAKIDPQTLAIVKIKHKDRDGVRARRPAAARPDASRSDAADASPPMSASATAPRKPLDR